MISLKRILRKMDKLFFKFKFKEELKIFTHLTFQEKYIIYKYAKNTHDDSTCCEIGSYFGASSCFIAAGISNKSKLYCIDTWGNHAMQYDSDDNVDDNLIEKDTYKIFHKNTIKYTKKIIELRGWSTDVSEVFWKSVLKLDFLFIDGDHNYEGVLNDWKHYGKKMKSGAIIIFHDTGWAEGVNKVIKEEVLSVANLEISLPNLQVYKII